MNINRLSTNKGFDRLAVQVYNNSIRTFLAQTSLATIIGMTALSMLPVRITYQISPPIAVSVVEAKTFVPFILKKIAWCESKGRQFNADGSLQRGVKTPEDVGRYQINEWYHLKESLRLGLDIHTLEGNTDYALYLYDKNGTRDWNWSKHCWDDRKVSDEMWNSRLQETGLLE